MFQSPLLFMFDSPMQIMLVVGVVFLLFGSSKLPQFAKSIGATRKAFKEGMREAEDEEKIETEKRQQLSANAASNVSAPPISAMSDEELMLEMRRRAEVKPSKVDN